MVILHCENHSAFSVTIVTDVTWSRGGFNAQLATAAPFLEVPSRYFRPVMDALGGMFDAELNMYTVSCSHVEYLPSITMNIGSGFGLIYSVSAKDYVAKIVRSRWRIPHGSPLS